jgi:hypothetical protein
MDIGPIRCTGGESLDGAEPDAATVGNDGRDVALPISAANSQSSGVDEFKDLLVVEGCDVGSV